MTGIELRLLVRLQHMTINGVLQDCRPDEAGLKRVLSDYDMVNAGVQKL